MKKSLDIMRLNHEWSRGEMMSGEGYRCFATAAFGTEGLVAGELKRLGFDGVRAETGGACFRG